MIDIENIVFDNVARALRLEFPDVYMVNAYISSPEQFPCVFLEEKNNSAYALTEDSASSENHAEVMYEATVFSNKAVGNKRECRKIAESLDAIMQGMGFRRSMFNPVPNLADPSIYRIVARYTAVVSAKHEIYRR
jgi:hypothetical protein